MIGAIIMGAITQFMITPLYESSAMLYVLNKTTSVTTMADIQIGSALSSDFEVIAKSKPVIDTAIKQLEEETGKRYTASYRWWYEYTQDNENVYESRHPCLRGACLLDAEQWDHRWSAYL